MGGCCLQMPWHNMSHFASLSVLAVFLALPKPKCVMLCVMLCYVMSLTSYDVMSLWRSHWPRHSFHTNMPHQETSFDVTCRHMTSHDTFYHILPIFWFLSKVNRSCWLDEIHGPKASYDVLWCHVMTYYNIWCRVMLAIPAYIMMTSCDAW